MGTKRPTKHEQVRTHLLNGNTISQKEAIALFDAYRLSSIIHTLIHKEGIDIESCTEQSSGGARYSRYWVSKKFLEEMHNVDAHCNGQA